MNVVSSVHLPRPRTSPASLSLPRLVLDMPAWMQWSAVALVVYPCFLMTPVGRAVDGTANELLANSVRLVIEAAAFLSAATRAVLPPRLRLALRITGWTSVASAANYMLLLPPRLGGPNLLSTTTDAFLTLGGYLAALWALLVYPRAPARKGEAASVFIDALVTAGGLGALTWTLVTEPNAGVAPDARAEAMIRVFGLSQIALLAGLNLVVVRGLAVPTARAFWWFIAGQAMYLPVVYCAQLQPATLIGDLPGDFAYFAGVLPTLVACHLMRTEPMAPGAARPLWLRDFNPLPLSMPLLLGVALLQSLVTNHDRALTLAVTLVGVSLLLSVRLLLSAHHTAEAAGAEAAREHRRQADRLLAVGRLAGGIAHQFNNLMARVVGNTELGEASLARPDEARDYLARAKAAALQAGELTRQLLAFSGQQRSTMANVDLAELAHGAFQRIAPTTPNVLTDWRPGLGPFDVTADQRQVLAAFEQLVSNALDAMPQGGRLTVRVGRERLRDPLETRFLSVPPGAYVVLTVSDTGSGIPSDTLPLVCDPFYTTKPDHAVGGLGLASVHGVVAAHSGGLDIQSTLGQGTTVRIYLPAA